MKESDATITTILGMRGCGKSALTHELVKDFPAKIIFDTMSEWKGAYLYANSVEEFTNLWRENFHKKDFTIVVTPPEFADDPEIIDLQTRITKLVYLTGRDSNSNVAMVFEEAQFYFPNQGLHPVNKWLFTTGRHAHISIIANSQRPALISKMLLSQSEKIYIGKLYEANDIAYLRDCVGDLAFQARELKPLEFIYYPTGDLENIHIIQL